MALKELLIVAKGLRGLTWDVRAAEHKICVFPHNQQMVNQTWKKILSVTTFVASH